MRSTLPKNHLKERLGDFRDILAKNKIYLERIKIDENYPWFFSYQTIRLNF